MEDANARRLRVTQIRSPIARRHDQRETLVGLGLNKLNRSRELVDTPSIRGMINKVRHLVRVEEIGSADATADQAEADGR